jgi:membrane protease YdiL (CAAX protease family)
VLREPTWRFEAIIRLVTAILVCQIMGGVVLAVVRFVGGGRQASAVLFAVTALGSLLGCVGALWSLRKPLAIHQSLRPFFVLLLSLYLGLALGSFVEDFAGKAAAQVTALRAIVGTLAFQGCAIVLILFFVRQHQLRPREAFGFDVNRPTALLYGALAVCAFQPVGWLLQVGVLNLMKAAHLAPETQGAVEAIQLSATWLDRAALGFSTILIAPPAEELIFRGILYPAIRQAGFPRLAFWANAVLFAAIHFNVALFVPLLALALLLTWLYERTGNLLSPILAHCLFNLANFILVCVTDQLSHAPPDRP